MGERDAAGAAAGLAQRLRRPGAPCKRMIGENR